MTLRILDTFSGIGGFSLAARWLGGFETVQFVEREPCCQRILRKHWPTVPIHDDICTFNPEPESADVVVGGFPCQDISTAGKQAGIKEGTRSGLFYELIRVVRLVGPRYIVLENVAAITSNGLDAVLGTLAEAGYDCEWACIPASAVGACHQRDRWWAVAYASGPDQPRWAEGFGRRISSAADAGGCGIPEGSWQPNGNAADANGLRSQRRGAAGDLAGQARAGTTDSQERQRHGYAADDCGATPDPMRHRLQGSDQLAGSRPQWPAAPLRLSPDWRAYVSQPVLCRGDDGLSGRVDRLKALGNAVVPQVAMLPLARVLDMESTRGYRL